jgi:hypothetical protein
LVNTSTRRPGAIFAKAEPIRLALRAPTPRSSRSTSATRSGPARTARDRTWSGPASAASFPTTRNDPSGAESACGPSPAERRARQSGAGLEQRLLECQIAADLLTRGQGVVEQQRRIGPAGLGQRQHQLRRAGFEKIGDRAQHVVEIDDVHPGQVVSGVRLVAQVKDRPPVRQFRQAAGEKCSQRRSGRVRKRKKGEPGEPRSPRPLVTAVVRVPWRRGPSLGNRP